MHFFSPSCWCLQTHIDIVSDFDDDLVEQLKALSVKHDFLIWEDRKFADIGEFLALIHAFTIQTFFTSCIQETPFNYNTLLESTRSHPGLILPTPILFQETG